MVVPTTLGIEHLDGPLALELEIDKAISSSWSIGSVIGYVAENVCPVVWRDTNEVDLDKEMKHRNLIYWYNIDMKATHRLVVRLRQLNQDISPKEAITKIKSSQNILTLKIYTRAEP